MLRLDVLSSIRWQIKMTKRHNFILMFKNIKRKLKFSSPLRPECCYTAVVSRYHQEHVTKHFWYPRSHWGGNIFESSMIFFRTHKIFLLFCTISMYMSLRTEDGRSMTTFYYNSVNPQSGLQRNTFPKLWCIFLIHQNVP